MISIFPSIEIWLDLWFIDRPNVTEEEIKNAFTAANFAPQAFKFFPWV